jgi:hypothetical protein
VLVVTAVALVGLGVSFGVAHGTSSGSSLAGGAPVSAQQGSQGTGAGSGGSAGNAAPGSSGAAGGQAGATASPGGAQHGSPAPTRTPIPTIAPTPGNQIGGTDDWQTSNCGSGWDQGSPCKIYYHGTYILFGVSGAKLIVTASSDGTTLTQQTFDAPEGGRRWGDQMAFLGPKGNEIDFQAVVKDASGKVVMQTVVSRLFNH